MYLLIGFIALLAALAFYSVFIEPRRLNQRHYLVRKNKERVLDISQSYDMFTMQTDITVAHISDTHFSRWYKPRRFNKVLKSLIEVQPDMIVFTGDLIDDYKHWPTKQTQKLIKKLQRLRAPMGKIAVLGNHDYRSDGQYFVQEVLKEAGFTTLVNEDVFGSDSRISMNIAGIADQGSQRVNYLYESTLAEWHLLLIHQPDYIDKVKNLSTYDLVLSGHSHGGQVRLPFHRVTTDGARRYTHSLYLPTNNTLLSVNTGLGTTQLPVRFGVPPEIIYYHLSNNNEKFEQLTDPYNLKKKVTSQKEKETTEPQAEKQPTPNPPLPAAPQQPAPQPQTEPKPQESENKVVQLSMFQRKYHKKRTVS